MVAQLLRRLMVSISFFIWRKLRLLNVLIHVILRKLRLLNVIIHDANSLLAIVVITCCLNRVHVPSRLELPVIMQKNTQT